MSAGLREAAIPLDALARTALARPSQCGSLETEVKLAADWLMSRQLANGLFPFPVGPALKREGKVGKLAASKIDRFPEIVVDGWIITDGEDGRDGGLQFDNGLCGHAMVSAWRLRKDERYLVSARRAADWAVGQPLVSNWNYNAFSVGLLARVAAVTDNPKYRQAAVVKANIGVLPGQLENGRWIDPHNASAVYHDILMRELIHLYRALPQNHPNRQSVEQAIFRGLNQAADETIAHGYTGTWTTVFADGLNHVSVQEKWAEALRVCVNAAGKNGAPRLGPAAVSIVEAWPRPKE